MNLEATKKFEDIWVKSPTKTAKKLKFDDESTQPTEENVEEDKDDKPTKKTGKRRKQIARKGLHTYLDKDDSEDSDEACRVHCLNLESVDIYMLIERKYPLFAEVCKAMLDKKLQGGKLDEDCYKLLKMMEKQDGIRK
ncbi:hypothetical protein Tco_0339877 [Tanacetum coccineum]